jgi:hypothetical protein
MPPLGIGHMGPVIVASEAATEVHVDLIKPILRTSAPSETASLGWRIVESGKPDPHFANADLRFRTMRRSAARLLTAGSSHHRTAA